MPVREEACGINYHEIHQTHEKPERNFQRGRIARQGENVPVLGMRIAVLADTHDRYPPGLPARLASADEIWHLGDVCEPEVLWEFEQLRRPMQVVLGNNEAHNLWPHSLLIEREGWRCYLTHIPPTRAPAGVNMVLHGHTHVPRDETDPAGVRWLNPGCISRPSRGAPASFAWLTLEKNEPPGWQIVPL